jgi:phosphoribosylamine--glycine ligase
MKVLVIGNGGREHALAWRLLRGASVTEVLVAPGNAGTAAEPGVRNVAVAVDDFEALVALARAEQIGLTVVGPEVPLVAGLRDCFDAAGLRCFGPSRAAAQLEGSKTFAKDFLSRHQIPTAAYATFTEVEAALAYVRQQALPIVIKADGLAAGKGVVVATTSAMAEQAVRDLLDGATQSSVGSRLVIEEFLAGEEASFICICDGKQAIPFATSQDHKARDEGDAGPNTGGMGAYSPAPVVTADVHARVMVEIVEPTLVGMASDGHAYQGFLYVGLMIDADGAPKVIEFNCRFGDPEAQPLMVRLRSDLAEICSRALDGDLLDLELEFTNEVALGVVMASGGYPVEYARGATINGLSSVSAQVKVFHAGTANRDGVTVTAGGRVLCVVGLGRNVSEAQQSAYAAVHRIHWHDCYYRRDIGYRAIAREAAAAR